MQYYETSREMADDLKSFCEKWDIKDIHVVKGLWKLDGKPVLSIRADDHSYQFSIESITGYKFVEHDKPEETPKPRFVSAEREEPEWQAKRESLKERMEKAERAILDEYGNTHNAVKDKVSALECHSDEQAARIDTLENQVEVLRELI